MRSNDSFETVRLRGLQKDILLWLARQYSDKLEQAVLHNSLEEMYEELRSSDSEFRERDDEFSKTIQQMQEWWERATKEEKRRFWARAKMTESPALERLGVDIVAATFKDMFDKQSAKIDEVKKFSGSVPWSVRRFLDRAPTAEETRNRSSYTRALNELEKKGFIEQIKGEGRTRPKTVSVRLKRDAYRYCYLLLSEEPYDPPGS